MPRRTRSTLEVETITGKGKALPKTPTGSRKKPVVAKHTELALKALFDIRAFADLIRFHGGWSNFGDCHAELTEFICLPQTDDKMQEFIITGDEYEAHLRRLVLMPRGHLKSTIGTVLYVMWRIYRNPNIRILVGCNLQSLAYSFIRELRSYFEDVSLLSVWNNRPHIEGSLLPNLDKRSRERNMNLDTEAVDRKVIWNNAALQVLRPGFYKEPTVYATSAGTTITGMHFDLVIMDDVIDFRNVESTAKKEQIEQWIGDIESVLNPPAIMQVEGSEIHLNDTVGGETLISGTRYAVDDYYAQVLERQEELGYHAFLRNIYKNGTDDTDGFLWHEMYTAQKVKFLIARNTPRRFASQYLNRVYEKDANLFATEHIRIIDDNCIYRRAGVTYIVRPDTNETEQVTPIIAVDPAFSSSKTSDDCAILVGFKLSDNTLVLADAEVDRMEAKTVVAKSRGFAEAYNTLRLFYEENGVGMLVAELFRHPDTYVNGKPIICFGHYEQRVKESKIQAVLELPIVGGKVWFAQRVRNKEYIWKQITSYPTVRKDDFLDGLVTLFERTTPARISAPRSLRTDNAIHEWMAEHKEKLEQGYLGSYKVL